MSHRAIFKRQVVNCFPVDVFWIAESSLGLGPSLMLEAFHVPPGLHSFLLSPHWSHSVPLQAYSILPGPPYQMEAVWGAVYSHCVPSVVTHTQWSFWYSEGISRSFSLCPDISPHLFGGQMCSRELGFLLVSFDCLVHFCMLFARGEEPVWALRVLYIRVQFPRSCDSDAMTQKLLLSQKRHIAGLCYLIPVQCHVQYNVTILNLELPLLRGLRPNGSTPRVRQEHVVLTKQCV